MSILLPFMSVLDALNDTRVVNTLSDLLYPILSFGYNDGLIKAAGSVAARREKDHRRRSRHSGPRFPSSHFGEAGQKSWGTSLRWSIMSVRRRYLTNPGSLLCQNTWRWVVRWSARPVENEAPRDVAEEWHHPTRIRSGTYTRLYHSQVPRLA